LSSKNRLEKYLRLEKGTLRKAERLIKYSYSAIPKADGGIREITNPSYELKKIQRLLLKYIRRIELSEWLMSAQKGRCYIDNARFHLGATYVATADIKGFYANCSSKKVYALLCDVFEMSTDLAGLINKLLSLDGHLPTGTPTSQIIAFWAYKEMFFEIAELAHKNGYKFTLYVDDLTFSGDKPISKAFINSINSILLRYDHRLKPGKIRFFSPSKIKTITGSCIDHNNNLSVPNKLRKAILNDILLVKFASRNELENTMLKAWGRLRCAQNIQSNIFPEITRLYKLKQNEVKTL
jgi:hypothetical protein